MTRRRVVVVGSLNADLVVRVERFPAPGETIPGSEFAVYPGGKGANQACAAGRLGAEVHMVGRVGDDDNGRLLTQSLADAGVDTSTLIADASVPTGTAHITIDASGQNHIVVVPGANGALCLEDVDRNRDLIENAGFVLLQLEVPLKVVEATARMARAGGAVVILDPAPARPDVWPLLGLVDFVTPNETELACLARGDDPAEADQSRDRMARKLLAGGARNVVSKLGADGARLLNADGEQHWPGLRVRVVDTTAAGDVWNGAFAVGLAAGMEVDSAGAFANAAAAVSVTRPGAQPSMPTRAEVVAFSRGNDSNDQQAERQE